MTAAQQPGKHRRLIRPLESPTTPRCDDRLSSGHNRPGHTAHYPPHPADTPPGTGQNLIRSTAPKMVHTKWFSGNQSVNDGGINNN